MIMMKLAPMLSNMSVGIIGGADGPTAVFVSSSPSGIISTILLIAGAVCFGVAIVKLIRKRKK